MSALTLTVKQLEDLALVLKELDSLAENFGVEFDPFGSFQIKYAGNTIRISSNSGEHSIDNYCS
jgi:hypothetical protein